MRLQFIRHEGRKLGISLIFRKRVHIIGVAEVDGRPNAPAPTPVPFPFSRLCDACMANEAMVFCRTHAQYLCEFCLSLHNGRNPRMPLYCEYLSMAAARDLIIRAVKHEAHT